MYRYIQHMQLAKLCSAHGTTTLFPEGWNHVMCCTHATYMYVLWTWNIKVWWSCVLHWCVKKLRFIVSLHSMHSFIHDVVIYMHPNRFTFFYQCAPIGRKMWKGKCLALFLSPILGPWPARFCKGVFACIPNRLCHTLCWDFLQMTWLNYSGPTE